MNTINSLFNTIQEEYDYLRFSDSKSRMVTLRIYFLKLCKMEIGDNFIWRHHHTSSIYNIAKEFGIEVSMSLVKTIPVITIIEPDLIFETDTNWKITFKQRLPCYRNTCNLIKLNQEIVY